MSDTTPSSLDSPPRTTNVVSLCNPATWQIRQVAHGRVKLGHLLQRNDHDVRSGYLRCTRMELPSAVLVIVRNMQNGLAKPHDLRSCEDRNVLRVFERPIVLGRTGFHEKPDVGEL